LRNAYKLLIRKLEGKRPLWRLGCRWEGDIKRDHTEIVYDGVNWVLLDVLLYYALVDCIECL
jgi:hypothetical protein